MTDDDWSIKDAQNLADKNNIKNDTSKNRSVKAVSDWQNTALKDVIQENKKLRETLIIAEQALGENLIFITDTLDLSVRQKDKGVLQRLHQLNEAWALIVKTLAEVKG